MPVYPQPATSVVRPANRNYVRMTSTLSQRLAFWRLCLLAACLLLLAGCGVSSPQTATTDPVLPSVPTVPARFTYVAIGASDAFGVGASDPTTQSWPAYIDQSLPPDVRFINLGIPGVTIHQALAQELPVALSVHPNLVTIWLGVNDLQAAVPLAQYQHDLDSLLTALATNTHAQVAVGNLPDLTLLPAFIDQDPTTLTKTIAAWNQVIASEVRQHHDLFVDLYQSSAALAQHPEDISSDGLHPTEAGYQLIAATFVQVLRTHHVIQ